MEIAFNDVIDAQLLRLGEFTLDIHGTAVRFNGALATLENLELCQNILRVTAAPLQTPHIRIEDIDVHIISFLNDFNFMIERKHEKEKRYPLRLLSMILTEKNRGIILPLDQLETATFSYEYMD